MQRRETELQEAKCLLEMVRSGGNAGEMPRLVGWGAVNRAEKRWRFLQDELTKGALVEE